MDFVDLTNPHRPTSSPGQAYDANQQVPLYFENTLDQLNFNPAVIVLALALYVLLVLLGIVTNTRVISVIRRRLRGTPFAFDIRLIDLDVLAISLSNLITILCFMFVIFDLVYGQWMLPSTLLCRLYLAAEGFSRVVSGLILMHASFLAAYFVRKSENTGSSSSSSVNSSKLSVHYVYVLVLCPVSAFVFAIALYEHGGVHFDSETITPILDLVNATELVTIEKCVLTMSNAVTTWLTIYGSALGYAAPSVALMCAAFTCRCRCRSIPDLCLRRYSTMIAQFGLVFFLCHIPAWIVSIYDYVVSNSYSATTSDARHQYTLAFVSYFAHAIGYFTCVGYPVLYLRNTNVNRISTDLSESMIGGSGGIGREETVLSLTNHQWFERQMSRDALLTSSRQRMRSRSRTFTSLTTSADPEAIVSLAIHRRASYHAFGDEREEEDQL